MLHIKVPPVEDASGELFSQLVTRSAHRQLEAASTALQSLKARIPCGQSEVRPSQVRNLPGAFKGNVVAPESRSRLRKRSPLMSL